MKSTRNLNKKAIAAAVAVAFAAPAFAQEAAEKIQRVEITGSSIKRTASEAAGAVQVLNRADIERTGATTALDILNNAAAIETSISSETVGSGSFATGSSGVGMRSLGKVSTLVLVNGRRIAQYGLSDGAQQNFTNLDAIASESIERIEILKDGASAIYGSDAVAGVVNIILRKDYVGAKVKASYSGADGFKDYRNRNATAIIGFGDIDTDGFNTWLSVEGYKRDGWTTGEIKGQYPSWHKDTPGRSTWDAKSAYSPTGNYFLSATNIVAAPGCPAEAIDPIDKQCKWDVLPYSGQTTDNKRWALASNTHFKIGNSIDANFEITSAGATNDYIVAPLATFTTSAPVNPWYNVYGGKMVSGFTYPKLPVGHPNNPYKTPTELRARMMDTGDGFNFNTTDSEQSRFMLALNGTFGTWDWKSAVGYMNSEATKATRATSAKGYTDAIVSKSYVFGQKNDPALLEKMFPVRTTVGAARILFADATVTGTVAELPAGPLNVAIGTDIRREFYEMKSSDNVLNGELVGIFGLQVKDVSKHYALFGEATIPVVKRVELSAALRADKSGNADAHVSPKLGLRWNPVDSLLLRATGAGGFRAPNIVESGNGLGRSSVSNSVNDPRRCSIANQLNALVQNAPGVTPSDKSLANTYRAADCSGSLPSFVASNPDLKPETSKSYTVGTVWQPTKDSSLAIDYFNIQRKDEIGTRAVADILKGESSLPAGQLIRIDNTITDNEFLEIVKKYAPTNTLNFGGVGKLGLVYNPYVNSGRTKVSGFDFDAATKFRMGAWGDLDFKLEGAYLLSYKQFSEADNKYNDNIAGNYDTGSRLRTKLRGVWKKGVYNNGLTVHYASSYSNNNDGSPTYCATNNVKAEFLEACGKVKANTTVDYSFVYTGIKNVRLSAFVYNLFDKELPVKWREGFTPWAPQLRTYSVSAAYTFF
ncbi:TonB-dependent receptor plug domain-containing protein [Pseudoduganella sp. OTU4001]|uniref:TonB-dependent receptor plug domain-containing protein n=1 Tax=Pseudoduganella sp. OTU4001 TaxID=3043854 RepID=UPI00313CACF4